MMAVFRIHRTEGFVTMRNSMFMDYSLSYKAKGVLAQMLSLPDGWDFSAKGLTSLASDGDSSVKSALAELEEHKYLRRTQKNNIQGRFDGYEYDIYECPYDSPLVDFPLTVNPITEKEEQYNNKNKINNNNIPLSVSTDIPQGEGCCVVEEYSKEEQLFEEFRRAYGGTKRGHSKEFENFKKKYRDWRNIAKLLMPAYQSQKQYREESIKQGCFVPQEQNLQTWINNEGWTYELSFQKDSRAIQQQQSINDDMRGIEEKYQESKRRNSIMQNLYDAGNF